MSDDVNSERDPNSSTAHAPDPSAETTQGTSAADWILSFAILTCLVWAGIMAIQSRRFEKLPCSQPYDLVCTMRTPMVELQLVSSEAKFKDIIDEGNHSNNLQVLSLNTKLDCIFVLLYWSVICSFALLLRKQEGTRILRWGVWVTITIAAVFDLWENSRLLRASFVLANSANAPFVLSKHVSIAKWIAFAAALTLLAFLLGKAGQYLLTAFLGASAISTIVGLWIPAGLTASVGMFGLALLVALKKYSPFSLEDFLRWLEYAYLMRFQLIAAAVVALVLPVCYWAVPSIFVGIFDARDFWSFAFVAWAAFQFAWTVMLTCRMVLVYGPSRFSRASLKRKPSPVGLKTTILFGLIALPSVVVTSIGTLDLTLTRKLTSAAIGLGMAVAVLFGISSLQFFIERDASNSAGLIVPSFGFLRPNKQSIRSGFWQAIDTFVSKWPKDISAGLLTSSGQLGSGHQLAFTAVLLLICIYIVLGVMYLPWLVSPEKEPAALFFVLFLFTFWTWIMSGAAFALDRFRFPVLTSLLVLSLLTGTVRTDHKFALRPSKKTTTAGLFPGDVISAWERGRGKGRKKIISIVATAGGGIRAAAWTAEVLTRLQSNCGENLSASVILVSSVSGGSVGAMFFLAPYEASTGTFPTDMESLNNIRFNAARSSLSAVGWGFLYPDLLRTIPLLGSFVPQSFDRGWSLENAWVSGWHEPPNISDWRRDVASGTRPAVMFNATAAESGERFIIGSTDTVADGTVRFPQQFGDWDMPIATAARLSATFPYVSPIARSSDGPREYRLHVADGGYYDNSGVLTAVEWLKEASGSLVGYKVLFITIDAGKSSIPEGEEWSWQRQMTAPIETLANVRSSSQEFRDKLEMEVGLEYLTAKYGIDITAVRFPYQAVTPSPLSWHLNSTQKLNIRDAWDKDQKNADLIEGKKTVYSTLNCKLPN